MLTSQYSQLCVIDRFITIPICLLLKTEPSMVCFVCIFFSVRAWRTKRQIFKNSSAVTHRWSSTNCWLCCFSSFRLFPINKQCLKHSSITTACENGVFRIVLIFGTNPSKSFCNLPRDGPPWWNSFVSNKTLVWKKVIQKRYNNTTIYYIPMLG